MRFKTDWASLIVGRKFTVFALFYFVFEGNFQVQAPQGAYIWRVDLTEGFLRYEFILRASSPILGERNKTRSSKTRFARPNRRACSQAITSLGGLYLEGLILGI